jgi:hypothetical protein
MTISRSALVSCLAVLVAALTVVDGLAQQQGRGGGRGVRSRKTVLAWADTRNGIAQHESVGHALAIIERLGYESGMWDTYIRTDSNIIATAPKKTDGTPASGGPSLANVDAIFFMGHREVPLDDSQKAELLQFVRDGHGLVAAHVGLSAFESWPEFGEMMGGRFDQHPIVGPGTVVTRSAFRHSIFLRRSRSTTSSISRRICHATRSTCCFGWISKMLRRIRPCI